MVVRATSSRQFNAWQARVLPPVETVRPGLWSLPVPMTNNRLGYSLAYALSVADGLVLFDSGWPDASAYDALRRCLRSIGYAITDVVGVLITHAHPDHLGLADDIRRDSGAWIGMHRVEADVIASGRARTIDVEGLRHEQVRAFVASGAAVGDARRAVAMMQGLSWLPHRPVPDRVFEDGELVVPEHAVSAVWTPGHTPGHCCYYLANDEFLITGDTLLPRISPNITARIWETDSPLEDYVSSLLRISALRVAEVLPGHEFRFSGHADRVEQLRRHHEARLDEIEAELRRTGGATTWDVARRLEWARPWKTLEPRQWAFALGETLSHLRYLRASRRVEVEDEYDAPQWRVLGQGATVAGEFAS